MKSCDGLHRPTGRLSGLTALHAPPAALSAQNPFKYPRQMEGLQGPLSQLPTVGVYVLGAALAAVLGGGGWAVVGAVAPGAWQGTA